ncbi:hypothetical protein DL546_008003 [Coniochaeta pulveracea]|uniref:Uncharacterized protein n=1 Tax=Coniochaeta pulveracea TaxID=177199 RepID=A0A420YBS6_9PEZI|nr:hypothetical protein DL546_008003 [Coniochaeta pulveracea]
MSWMDSWSRPSKSQATPAPFYLLPGGENTPYCPLDRKIEKAFVAFLTGQEELPVEHRSSGADKKVDRKGGKGGSRSKGDPRVVVSCDAVENFLFGQSNRQQDAEPAHDHDFSDASLDLGEGSENGSYVSESVPSVDGEAVDLTVGSAEGQAKDVDGHRLAALSIRSGTRKRPPQHVSEVNGSVGGEKGRAERAQETGEALEKRLQGQRKVKEREMVRCAARRGVVFGFAVGEGEEKKKCEAIMHGKVVEPSFAKGDWGIRWRE